MYDANTYVTDQLARLWPFVADLALAELRTMGQAGPSVFFLSDQKPSYVLPLGSIDLPGTPTNDVVRDMAAANGVLVVGLWFELRLPYQERQSRCFIATLTTRESAMSDRLVVYRGVCLLELMETTGWTPVERLGEVCDRDPNMHIAPPLLPPWRRDGSLENIIF